MNKLEMRAMLASSCAEGIMDNKMVKSQGGFTQCWFFLNSEVQPQPKQELKKNE